MDTPYSVTVLEETSSTQDDARRFYVGGRPAVVIAHRQTGGRGRSGSEWENAPRSVAVSVAFEPRFEPARWSLIPLLAGVAAVDAFASGIGLKWPNDLERNGSKVGGILVEASAPVVVAGLGVNLYWPDAPAGRAGLFESDPSDVGGPELARKWAGRLLELVGGNIEDWPIDRYRSACTTLGQEITWEPDGRGRAMDITTDGLLVVETAEGRRQLSSGAVRHIRPG